jgi:ATP synthase protein I
VNGFGRAGAYFALFSEIGIILLTTTLIGVLGGNWLDDRLATRPIFILIGLLTGFGGGGVAVYRLITRFLARYD